MDMTSIAAAGAQSSLPTEYSMRLMRKAMGTETSLAAREISMMMPQIPQAPAVPKGQFLDVYA